MKPERIQGRRMPVTPERLQQKHVEIRGWEVDATPNAIERHFPQPSFQASADFLKKVASNVEKSGRTPFFYGGATGVTVRLGNPPNSGVTEADVDLAMALNSIA